MVRSTGIILHIILCGCSLAMAQPLKPGEWRTYTAMTNVTDLAVNSDSGSIWVATKGGVYLVPMMSPSNASVRSFRNSDGLSDNDISSLALGLNTDLYVGNRSGGIDIIRSSGEIENIRDIFNASQFTQKQIMKITISDSLLYIATGFGLVIYNLPQRYTIETIPQFASFTNQDTVFDVTIKNDSIFAVLSGGLAVAPKNSQSLKAPFTWRIIPAPAGTNLHAITNYKGQLVVGTPQGLFVRDGDSFTAIPLPDSISFVEMTALNDSLYILDAKNNGRILTTGDLVNFQFRSISTTSDQKTPTALAIANDRSCSIGYSVGGVTIGSSSGTTSGFSPDGPLSNEISGLHFSPSLRKLFAVYAFDGLTSFEPDASNWTLFRAGGGVLPKGPKYRFPFFDSIRKTLWVSAYGPGAFGMVFDPVPTVKNFAPKDGLTAVASGTDFTTTAMGQLDNHGNFCLAQWAYNGAAFAKTSDGNTFTSVVFPGLPGDPAHSYHSVVQDLDDIYYVATENVTAPPPYGVVALLPDGTSETIPGGSGGLLGSPGVNAILVDQDNGLWCGTTVGVQVVSHSRDFQTGKLKFHPRTLTFLDQQIVHSMTVDGIGNKWVGTEDGVFVVSADGTDSLAHFTTSNSPLISNFIVSVAIDNSTGEAYFGTDKGISRTSTIFSQGSSDYSNISLYPNPIIQQGDDPVTMTIKGLVQGSTVKVFTVGGRLVASIDATSLGGSVRWNCRDENNKLLPSGVYIVAATSENVKESGQTKFVLVRK